MKVLVKYCFVVASLVFVGTSWLYGQDAKYDVSATPICWSKSGLDSNLVRYSLVSTQSGQLKKLYYVNALGAIVNPVGGIFKMGWCCNCSGGTTFVPKASNGLSMDGDTTELGGRLNRTTNIQLNNQPLNFLGRGSNEGVFFDDVNNQYQIQTGDAGAATDASVTIYKNNFGFAQILLAAQKVLIGVPASNGYYLPYTRPGGTPETYPASKKWFPVWNGGQAGTGSDVGWFDVENLATLSQVQKDTAIQTTNVTVANTTTETTLTSANLMTLPANSLTVGRTLRIKMSGFFTATASTPTLTIKFKIGGNQMAQIANVIASSVAGTNMFTVEGDFTIRNTGATGSIIGQAGGVYSLTSSTSDRLVGVVTSPTLVNTTIANAVTVTAQWSAASASNSITSTNCTIQILK